MRNIDSFINVFRGHKACETTGNIRSFDESSQKAIAIASDFSETKQMTDLSIALYQPDIPQNTGTILRMAACLDLHVHIIEPCGFALNDRTLRRAGMDYLERSQFTKHLSWDHFLNRAQEETKRLLLATTKAEQSFLDVSYRPGDILLFGRESVGVPDDVHASADHRLTIPMKAGERSLNLAISTAMVATEAMRQLKAFPR